jgi:hypothetical protein
LNAAYVALGIYVLISHSIPSPVLNWIFGLAAIAYGVFRGIRAYQSFRQEEGTEKEEERL